MQLIDGVFDFTIVHPNCSSEVKEFLEHVTVSFNIEIISGIYGEDIDGNRGEPRNEVTIDYDVTYGNDVSVKHLLEVASPDVIKDIESRIESILDNRIEEAS